MAEGTDADRRTMAGIRRRWREEDLGGPVDDPGFEDRAAAWIEANASHRLGWLAELDGEAVGMLTMIIVERMPIPGVGLEGWGYVHHFVVDPAHRNQGIGKALMDAAAEEGRARGWRQLVLHPRERSVPFYLREGFEPSDLLVRKL
jgi:GNAT superfamily N-acetyltransferase